MAQKKNRSTRSKKKTVKRTLKSLPKKTAKKRSTNKINANTWELVPFVVAVVVAIIVVAQSMESTRQYNVNNKASLMEGQTHMAAEDCELTGAPLRELRSTERALQRTVESLNEADTFYQWECATHTNDLNCLNAKRDLRREDRLVKQKIQEVQLMRIEACL